MVRFDDVEWAKFLTLYEQSGVYAKAVFVKSRVFGETFKVVKVDKTMIEFYEKLSSFHAQFLHHLVIVDCHTTELGME